MVSSGVLPSNAHSLASVSPLTIHPVILVASPSRHILLHHQSVLLQLIPSDHQLHFQLHDLLQLTYVTTHLVLSVSLVEIILNLKKIQRKLDFCFIRKQLFRRITYPKSSTILAGEIFLCPVLFWGIASFPAFSKSRNVQNIFGSFEDTCVKECFTGKQLFPNKYSSSSLMHVVETNLTRVNYCSTTHYFHLNNC